MAKTVSLRQNDLTPKKVVKEVGTDMPRSFPAARHAKITEEYNVGYSSPFYRKQEHGDIFSEGRQKRRGDFGY